MKQILFLFLLWVTHSAFCQEREASIIFNDDSKVKGLGEIKNNKIYFRISVSEKPETWSYDIAKGIDFDGMGYSEKYEYVTSDRNNKPILMEVIDEGEINLYKDYASTVGPSVGVSATGVGAGVKSSELEVVYFVKRKSEIKARELTFSFKSRALKIFSDCDAVIERIKSREFTKQTIPDLVAFYNNYCYKE